MDASAVGAGLRAMNEYSFREPSALRSQRRVVRALSAAQRFDQLRQRLHFNQLHHTMIESVLHRSLMVLHLPITGQCNQDAIAVLRRAPYSTRHLVAIDIGQSDVEKYHAGLVLAGHLERR